MDKEGYRTYLTDRKEPIPEEKIEPAISMIERFEEFVGKAGRTLESATTMDLRNFSKILIEEEANTYDNYLALSRYGFFIYK